MQSSSATGRPQTSSIHRHPTSSLSAMGLAALGIVFGDIGTSPLYTLKTVLSITGGTPDVPTILGILSLIIWTLVLITTIKYVTIAMSIDNDGEGGILALMSLIGGDKRRPRQFIIVAGLVGAALIYGDGSVTPAISVLSALEGLNMVTPTVQPYILPGAVSILVLLFAAQPLGTERIGKAFGPVMVLWFLALAAMGIAGMIHHPAVLAALSPVYGINFLLTGGIKGFLALGAIFLCVTGAEALYADMGHFGPKPIRISWLGVVFPSLILNYAGQAAIVVDGGSVDGNIFYRLCPGPLLIPLVILATLATVIASQAIITGAFSMTRQAIQLGWLPRMAIKQTSDEGYGQIYVGGVNWILMIVTVALTLGFRKSDNLASAYGIAVSLTMLMTTVLLFVAMREVLKWKIAVAGAIALCMVVVDAAFFCANLIKVADGGYIPLLIAAVIYGLMLIWHRGSVAMALSIEQDVMAVADFNAQAVSRQTPRVPGTALFLTRTGRDVPPILLWHLQHNRALHEKLLVLTVRFAAVPWIDPRKHLTMQELAPKFWRAEAIYGFMQHPDIPLLLADAKAHGCDIDLDDVTFYVGHASVMRREDGKGIPRWQEAIFAVMERNCSHVGDVLNLPQEKTVEIGRQIAI